MDLSTTTDAAAAFAQATPLATAKMTGDAGVQTLEVRKNKDDYFAKSSAVDGIYKVDSSVGHGGRQEGRRLSPKETGSGPRSSSKVRAEKKPLFFDIFIRYTRRRRRRPEPRPSRVPMGP